MLGGGLDVLLLHRYLRQPAQQVAMLRPEHARPGALLRDVEIETDLRARPARTRPGTFPTASAGRRSQRSRTRAPGVGGWVRTRCRARAGRAGRAARSTVRPPYAGRSPTSTENGNVVVDRIDRAPPKPVHDRAACSGRWSSSRRAAATGPPDERRTVEVELAVAESGGSAAVEVRTELAGGEQLDHPGAGADRGGAPDRGDLGGLGRAWRRSGSGSGRTRSSCPG